MYYPTITNGELNYIPVIEGKWFKAQLWKNDNIFWEGYETDEDKGVSVTWDILAESSNIKIEDNIFSYVKDSENDNYYDNQSCYIIKVNVKYNNKN
jgi:hypothetical protein